MFDNCFHNFTIIFRYNQMVTVCCHIDYVGSIDGVEFEGGSTNGAGTDLTIGSCLYIDDFEEQLIGAHPGDSVEVNVTFPDDYQQEDLQGKESQKPDSIQRMSAFGTLFHLPSFYFLSPASFAICILPSCIPQTKTGTSFGSNCFPASSSRICSARSFGITSL